MATHEVYRNRRVFTARIALAAVLATALALALSATARAATIMVNSLADTGAPGICVLRDAITAANTKTATNGCAAGDGNDTIQFSVTGTIALASTLPMVTATNLTISGPAWPGITLDGGGTGSCCQGVGIMQVAAGAGLNLNGLAMVNGYSSLSNGDGNGGAIDNNGSLTVTNSTISRNSAESSGGGIVNHGTLSVINSIISGNRAQFGGGIINFAGTLTVTNSTFSGNRASSSGGGIWNEGGATLSVTNSTFSGNGVFSMAAGGISNFGFLSLKNTIIANSIAAGGSPGFNCSGSNTDAGYNISDDSSCGFSAPGSLNNTDPLLDPAGLRNNGGPTRTIALLSGSPAIDAIPVADCTDLASPPNPVITDQRLFPRPDSEEDRCDIGAYEFADTPFIPFAGFRGGLTIDAHPRVLNLRGSFNLGTGGSIDPSTQPVAFSVGQNAFRLPVGSFVQNAAGYVYQTGSGNSPLRVAIRFTSRPDRYRLSVYQQGVPQFTSPVPVTLTIGNNSGSTLMNATFD